MILFIFLSLTVLCVTTFLLKKYNKKKSLQKPGLYESGSKFMLTSVYGKPVWVKQKEVVKQIAEKYRPISGATYSDPVKKPFTGISNKAKLYKKWKHS